MWVVVLPTPKDPRVSTCVHGILADLVGVSEEISPEQRCWTIGMAMVEYCCSCGRFARWDLSQTPKGIP